jgi:sugar transferase EpsL
MVTGVNGSAPPYLTSLRRRVVDLVLAGLATLVVTPVLILVGVLITLADGRPVLFRQERLGLAGRPFRLLKFRTMRTADDDVAGLLDGGTRVTRLGEVLRRTSLDELPELLNVIRGDMSLVGPRPLLRHHLSLYRATHPERLLARPGLTGLAQVSGRKQLTFGQRLDLDVEYVRNASFSLDLRILVRTVGVVLAGLRSPSEGELELVDDIGLADAIRSAAGGSERWEHGSALQPHGLVGQESAGTSGAATWAPATQQVYGTARQAMLVAARDANRVLVPTYYCPDVVEVLRQASGAEIVRYPDSPLAGPSTLLATPGDLVVVVPYFGRPTEASVDGGRLLIDATHCYGLIRDADGTRAPVGLMSDAAGRPADLCIASLRKTLPVPDGAAMWSPTGAALPEPPALDPAHAAAASQLASALDAKAAILRGERDDKDAVLARIVSATAHLEASTVPSRALPTTLAALTGFDLTARWEARARNRTAAVAALRANDVLGEGRLEVLDAPFMLILLAPDRESRDALRGSLIRHAVYPAVLWAHDDLPERSNERDFGARMLALHVDARYSTADLERVVGHLSDAVAERTTGR